MAKILLVQAMKINRVNPIIAPPLGLMYLASALRRKDRRHRVKILDLRLQSELEEEIIAFQPHVVGLSTMTQDAIFMHSIARRIKEIRRQSLIIVGGPHAIAYPDEVLRDPNIDYLAIGEGEETVCELVERIESKWACDNIEGIGLRRNGEMILTPSRQYITELDEIPFPSWDLIDIDAYTRNPRCNDLRASKERFMIVLTSRGCPYNCIYCHNIFGKNWKARSPENVLLEIEVLYHKYNVREIEIWDDIFNLDLDRAKRIADLIRKSKMRLRISFPNGLRADRIDRELLIKLKEAGTYHIAFAIETASERLQAVIKKNLNLRKANEAISLATRLGIFTRGFFMQGFPTETREEMLETIRFARKSPLHMASFYIPNAFKRTELFEMARRLGVRSDFDYNSYDYNIGHFSLSRLSYREANKLRCKAYLLFYLQGKRLWRLILRLPKKRQLLKYALQFWRRISSLLSHKGLKGVKA